MRSDQYQLGNRAMIRWPTTTKVIFFVFFIILQSGGPPKKGKSASALSAKGKKVPETKEFIETELSVSWLITFHGCFADCNVQPFHRRNTQLRFDALVICFNMSEAVVSMVGSDPGSSPGFFFLGSFCSPLT